LEVVNGLEDIKREPDASLTVGSFDGVHLGHRRILMRMHDYGHRPLTVMTFDPHPQAVVRPYGDPPPQLTTFEDRKRLFEELGVDRLVIIRFDTEFAGISARDFIDHILLEKVGMSRIFIGPTHGFGSGRRGNAGMLAEMAAADGFDVEIVPPVVRKGRYVSSSRIRKCLQAGDSRSAMHFLGRPYYIRGDVVPGDGRGQALGFPTANLKPDNSSMLMPPPGVYATITEVDGKRLPSVSHFGDRPTFTGAESSVETHIFDFEDDIYEKWISIGLVEMLREIKSFDSPAELSAQIIRDAEDAKVKLIESGFGPYSWFPERRFGKIEN